MKNIFYSTLIFVKIEYFLIKNMKIIKNILQ